MKDKTIIVTGGSRGIGREICLEFARLGANVVLNYNKTSPSEIIKEIEELGSRALAVQADISKFDEAKVLIDTAVKEFGKIDVVVNNAGITRDNLLMRMSEKEFDDVINVNLKGSFNITRHISKVMLKQREGTIINITSVVGITGNAGQANYSASKAGLIGLTYSTARELAQRGITCNAIAPGFIKTDMTDALNESTKEDILKTIPLKRFGLANEVAKTVVFLAQNKYITGQVINVDGGMVMA